MDLKLLRGADDVCPMYDIKASFFDDRYEIHVCHYLTRAFDILYIKSVCLEQEELG